MKFTIKDHIANTTSEPVDVEQFYATLLRLRGAKLTPAFAERAHVVAMHLENSAGHMAVGEWTTLHDMDAKPEYVMTAVQL